MVEEMCGKYITLRANFINILRQDKILEIEELHNYVIKELKMNICEFSTKLENTYKYGHLDREQKIKLDEINQRLLTYLEENKRENSIPRNAYYNKYHDLIEKLKKLSTMENLEGSELATYLKEEFNYTAVNLRDRIKVLRKHDFLTNEELESLSRIYIKVKGDHKRKASEVCIPPKPFSDEELMNFSINIEEFIESGKTPFEYRNNKGKSLTSEQVNIRLKYLEKYNPELYKEYIDYIKAREIYLKRTVMETKNYLIDKIENGIPLKDGQKRNFDILDYYLLIDIPLADYLALFKANSTDNKQIRTLSIFYQQNSPKELSNKEILNFLNCEFRRNNVDISEEIKLETLNYLYQYRIPITAQTIRVAIDRYISNTLYEKNVLLSKIRKEIREHVRR